MKKAYLSISALLAVLVLSGCGDPVASSSETSSSADTSTETSSSVETSSSKESSSEESSSQEDVFTYELSVVAPSVTTYEVGDTFDFSAIAVSLTTYKNGKIDGAAATLSRDEYIVKVNGQTIDGNFTFSEKGEVEFIVSSKVHPEASKSFKVTAKKHFAITNGSSDKVVLTGLPEKAEAGDTVSFGLTLLPGYYFEGTIKITKNDGTAVEFTDDDNYGYSFVMPEGNVVITVGADLTDFTISKDDDLIGNIVYKDAEDETKSVFSATAGTELKFKTLDSIDYSFTKVFIDGVEASVGEDGYYHFSMPHHPVVISTDKGPRDYSIESNADSLTLSTVTMYTDAEAKTPITKAHKGQTVYLKMSYEVTLVKYSISITDSEDNVIAVTQDETDPALFSFTMISSDLAIEITEDDWSKYAGYYVTDKVWKGAYVYEGSSSYSKVETKTYDAMTSSSYQFEFYGNGKGKKGSYDMTWNTTGSASDTSGLISIDYSSYTDKAFYYTAHLSVTKSSDYASSAWTDVAVGTWDENTTVHTVGIGKRRIIWAQNDDGDITEKILVTPTDVYTNFGFYTDSTKETLIKGDDVTSSFNAYVEISGTESFEVVNGKYVASYGLTAEEDDSYSIVFKDADGNAITSAKNGSTVYLYGSLKEGVDSSITIKSPTVTYNESTKVTTTAVSGQENVWSFTMPEGDVSASLTLNNPNKMAGHAALGTYYGFDLYSYTAKDRDYSSNTQTVYAIKKDATFTESSTYSSSSYDITSYDTTASGSIELSSGKAWLYGNGVIARQYSSSSCNDVYVAIKVPDGQDAAKIKTKLHWMSSGDSWALEFYSYTDDSETLMGGIFSTGNKLYLGATFEMTNGSERIQSGATYNVKMDGETIFTVANDKVTAAE